MKTAKIVLACAAAMGISISAAAADQTGRITVINRLDGTIQIAPMQGDTVGANTGDAAQQFSVKDASMLDNVHAGDRVTYTASENGGGKTITKLQRY